MMSGLNCSDERHGDGGAVQCPPQREGVVPDPGPTQPTLLERTEFVSNDDQFLNVRSRRSLSQLYHLLFKRVEL